MKSKWDTHMQLSRYECLIAFQFHSFLIKIFFLTHREKEPTDKQFLDSLEPLHNI